MDKAKLLQRLGAKLDVEIPDVGTVTVRGLTRAEVKAANEYPEDDRDLHYLAAGMVDPKMTIDEVKQWLDAAPASDYVVVMRAIAELSGIDEGAQKSSVPGVRRRSRR